MTPGEMALKASIEQRLNRLRPDIENRGTALSVTIRDKNFILKLQSQSSSGITQV